jgi:hypothetical protein
MDVSILLDSSSSRDSSVDTRSSAWHGQQTISECKGEHDEQRGQEKRSLTSRPGCCKEEVPLIELLESADRRRENAQPQVGDAAQNLRSRAHDHNRVNAVARSGRHCNVRQAAGKRDHTNAPADPRPWI